MKAKLLCVAVSSLYLASALNVSYALPPAGGDAPPAPGYSSSAPPAGGDAPPAPGYNSSGAPAGSEAPPAPGGNPLPPAGGGTPPAPGTPTPPAPGAPMPPAGDRHAPRAPVQDTHHSKHKNEKSGLRLNLILPTQNGPIFLSNQPRRHHDRGPYWVEMYPGSPFPQYSFIGGHERNRALFVCQARFQGGVHPGKVVGSNCNITFAGDEISIPNYQVLVSRTPLSWVPVSHGATPVNAFQGGYMNGQPLYVCQARFRGNMVPGKVMGATCNIGANGREVSVPFYNILVS